MPPILPLPNLPEDLTADWLTQALRANGCLGAGRVVARQLVPLAAAQSFTGGQIFQCVAICEGGSGPATMVVKLAPSDAGRRAAFAPLNAAEATFYATASEGLPVPRCFVAQASAGASVLLLEDLTHWRSSSVAEGATLTETFAMVAALAQVHARYWGAPPPIAGPDFLTDIRLAAALPGYDTARRQLVPGLDLPAAVAGLLGRWAADAPALLARMQCGPVTLLHRDAHVGNALFHPETGAARLIDWQFAGAGRAGLDLGYLLISSLPPDLRRKHQAALLARYHAAICAAGVRGYDAADLWKDYLLGAVLKYWLTVVATVAGDNEGAAKRAYRQADLTRLIAFCQDYPVLCKQLSRNVPN